MKTAAEEKEELHQFCKLNPSVSLPNQMKMAIETVTILKEKAIC
jgi:hypothetical protein